MQEHQERVDTDEHRRHDEPPGPAGTLQFSHAVVPGSDHSLLAAGVGHELGTVKRTQ